MTLEQRRELERKLLATATRKRSAAAVRPLPEAEGPVPVSLAQRRLYFFYELRPHSPLYHSSACFELVGSCDVEALARAVDGLLARHDILRTRLVKDADGVPLQHVDAPDARSRLSLVPRPAGLTDEAWESEARRQLTAFVNRPFALERDWPIRISWWALDERRSIIAVSLHHIASDGRSIEVLLRDLERMYAHATGATDTPPAPLAVQYADFSRWQQSQLEGESWKNQLDYWENRLSGLPDALDIPMDRPRSASQSFRGNAVEITVPEDVAQRVHRFSAQQKCTAFTTLMAAFHVLLHRYSGEDSLAVGTPVSGRGRPEHQDLIGFFVNTLAIRADFRPEATFVDIVRQIRDEVLEGLDRQDVPFDLVVNRLGLGRRLSHNPVFQHTFQYNAGGAAELTLRGLECRRVWPQPQASDFDLSMYINETAGGLTGWLSYSTDLFTADTAQRVVRHFVTLLDELLTRPELPVAHARFLAADERLELLGELAGGPRTEVPRRSLHDCVAEQARLRPHAPAVMYGDESLSYADLWDRSGRLAAELRGRGVGPGDVVALLLPPSPAVSVAVVGVLRAGAAYLGVDPRFTGAWVDHALADSGARLVVTTRELRSRGGGLPVLLLDARRGESPGEHAGAPVPVDAAQAAPRRHDLAYVVYTGGSTGRPKGVMIEHGCLESFIEHGIAPLAMRAEDRVLQFSSLSFDASVEELVAAFATGAALVVKDERFDLSPARFTEWCRQRRVTVLDLPTAYWHELVDAGASAALAACPDLRLVCIGGEAAAPDRVRRWQAEAGSRVRLLNGYGPSECTITATWTDLTETEIGDTVPVGRPVGNLRAYVLDANGEPVVRGGVGELCLAGPSVARGYLGRGDLTAAAFTPDPYGTVPGERLYRTGDRARFLPDGTIALLGRLDDQMKFRGYRIEPGDIEAALRTHPQVREAVVRLRTDQGGERRLVAYVVPSDPRRPGMLPDDMRRHLAGRLPGYMVPSALVEVADIPRTPSGKLDAARLPQPPRTATEPRRVTPPRDETERTLCRLWQELLGRENAGIEDDFFLLGGHSLLAVQLVHRIEQECGVALSVSALFPSATPERIAELLRGRGHHPASTGTALLRDDPEGRLTVLVHPVGGDITCYLPLSRALPAPASVLGLRSPALDGGDLLRDRRDLPELAVVYADLLEACRAEPSVFAGWSLGGVMALEVAREWRRRHGRALPVVLIDTAPPEPVPSGCWDEDRTFAAFARDIGSVLGVEVPDTSRLGRDERVQALHDCLADSGRISPGSADESVGRRYEVFREHLRLAAAYRPRPYDGPMTLMYAAGRPDAAEVVAAWRAVATSGLRAEPLPGDHYTLMTQELAARVAGCWPLSVNDRERATHG
ncbi:amino acid adenylation domain-containing protein [Streptomyces nogalater]|uniref:Amino acid adenylation domain-containing protein n=1 Tax=Streptomyces nogalater TaxID=38314 RepID=A0ABW0WA61_STRNO